MNEVQKKPAREKLAVLHSQTVRQLPWADGVVLLLENSASTDFLPLLEAYKGKICQVHLKNAGGDCASALSLLGEAAAVRKYFASSKEEVIRLSKQLKEHRWLVCPEFAVEKKEDISFITGMGIAVDLLYRVEGLKDVVLMELLDFYLHRPELAVPVEPFHSILMSKLERRPLHLWSLHLLFPDLFVQVDLKGTDETPAVKNYLQALPSLQAACMSCRHFHLCLAWARFNKDTCARWQQILDILQHNANLLTK